MNSFLAALTVISLLATPAHALDAELRKRAMSDDPSERGRAAFALADEGSIDAAKLIRKLLTDEDTWVRDSAVASCARLKSAEAIAELVPLTRVSTAWKRWNAVEAIGATRHVDALPVLRDACDDGDSRVRLAALDEVRWFGRVPGADDIPLAASKSKDGATRAMAARALFYFETDAATARLRELLDDRDPGVRCRALDTLMDRDIAGAMEAVPRFAQSDEWRDRVQSVWVCNRARTREAVETLLGLMRDERRVVVYLAHIVLRRLAQLAYADDPELWDAWWKGARDAWVPPEGDLRTPPEGGSKRYAQFHGLDVCSDHVVFVIDSSNSMHTLMDEEGPRDGPSRWDRTVEQLTGALKGLPDSTYVNLILYGETVRPVFTAPRRLDARTREKLADVLVKEPSDGFTDVLSAMEAALRQDADTIFLLGDGTPNRGPAERTDRVRREIMRQNTYARRRIHSISVGDLEDWAKEMMRGIARDSGGRHVHSAE